jgi:membrane-bound lytic murein transglycosylase B
MNTLLKALLLALLALTGCSRQNPPLPPQPLPSYPSEPRGEHRPISLPGHFSAPQVSGDFAGYPELDAFVAEMEAKHGIPRTYLNGLFSAAQRKQWTLNYMNKQTTTLHTTPSPGAWSKYRAQFLTDLHIENGVAFWRNHESALRAASQRYGVPPEYILGIMGVETIYGRNMGKDRVLDALTTLAFDYPRRSAYFKEELEHFLVMATTEGINPLELKGSFAGAMGLGQFMPGSFLKWAVDHDGDGRRDLWQPEDAVGSIANYFASHGWRPGEPVTTPAVVDGPVSLSTGFDKQYALSELTAQGIRPANDIAGNPQLSLLYLRGNDGDQYRLGHNNFYVITRYNHSTHYAMAVHELAQAIKRRFERGN